MNHIDLLNVILTLRNDIWLQWGWVIAINVALIGWLIHRHGLYGLSEKLVATIAYSAFLILIYMAMEDVYHKIDMAANDLYAYDKYYLTHQQKNYVPVSEGIIKNFITQSPEYCAKDGKGQDCTLYSDNFFIAKITFLLSWIQNMVLFWLSRIWIASRKMERKKKENGDSL